MASEFTCPNCGRNYKHQKSLKAHLNYECGKEPQFACPVCPKRMKQRSSLYQHARIQHGLELSKSTTSTSETMEVLQY